MDLAKKTEGTCYTDAAITCLRLPIVDSKLLQSHVLLLHLQLYHNEAGRVKQSRKRMIFKPWLLFRCLTCCLRICLDFYFTGGFGGSGGVGGSCSF